MYNEISNLAFKGRFIFNLFIQYDKFVFCIKLNSKSNILIKIKGK